MDLLFKTKDITSFTRMGPRQMLKQIVNASYSVIGTYMLVKLFTFFLGNDCPISVVLSESMSPAFERGDILIFKNKPHNVGDMPAFQMYKNTIPIIHRSIKQFGRRTLTKGDNNRVDDVGLYRENQYYLEPEDIKASAVAYVPYFGMMTIWLTTIPAIKFSVMGFIALNVLFTRE